MDPSKYLGTLSSDTSSKLDIFGHDGHSLGVDSTQVGIFKETDQVCFASFLQSHDGRPLESEIGLEVLSNFSDQTLEWELSDEKLSALLVSTDFSKSNGTRSVTMRLLDSTCCRSRFASCLGGELLSGSLSSGRFSGSLLSTSHFESISSE
jgi:histone H3